MRLLPSPPTPRAISPSSSRSRPKRPSSCSSSPSSSSSSPSSTRSRLSSTWPTAPLGPPSHPLPSLSSSSLVTPVLVLILVLMPILMPILILILVRPSPSSSQPYWEPLPLDRPYRSARSRCFHGADSRSTPPLPHHPQPHLIFILILVRS